MENYKIVEWKENYKIVLQVMFFFFEKKLLPTFSNIIMYLCIYSAALGGL